MHAVNETLVVEPAPAVGQSLHRKVPSDARPANLHESLQCTRRVRVWNMPVEYSRMSCKFAPLPPSPSINEDAQVARPTALHMRQRPRAGLPHNVQILCKLASVADPNCRKPKTQSDCENDTHISPYIQTSSQQCVSPTWTQNSNPNSGLKSMPENVCRA